MIELDLHKKLFGADGLIQLQVKFTVQTNELVTLYGPSGAGKTSIIRMIAGLMKPDNGSILVDGVSWFDSQQKMHLRTQERPIGLVFQEYSLFPNMTVYENLKFALPKGNPEDMIEELLETIGLKNLRDTKPNLLSGGQKQRVALARAMVRKPAILLLDEPLSALDTAMRNKLQDDILAFHKRFGLTTILVSHDYHEVKKMSDRVLVIENGKIVNEGKVEEVF
ncbi:molybdate transport system ATP-binding protein [Aquiflexum balticum DSM 16537]|uniref:Molybdate transport system ATP-binding protein n=1 Tax=Aquiflexum balticum DSM 16537 TaxID=758820 RepID=A0A1W2H001_9BACT|nr:ATP-binding cassette domain-containing protein [Aquiflexum balticum]SMD42229.1 molybdate transport system ATP-binding protein [Aquiflexum balticum DSM 16537]